MYSCKCANCSPETRQQHCTAGMHSKYQASHATVSLAVMQSRHANSAHRIKSGSIHLERDLMLLGSQLALSSYQAVLAVLDAVSCSFGFHASLQRLCFKSLSICIPLPLLTHQPTSDTHPACTVATASASSCCCTSMLPGCTVPAVGSCMAQECCWDAHHPQLNATF